MSVANIAGWIVTILGGALWVYGYYVTGNVPLIDWQASAPAWFSAFLPNLEAELGFALMIAGSIPIYWDMYRQRA
jgi:hypothetical protein